MKRLLLTTAMLGALTAPSFASIQDLSISGNLDGHAYTGQLFLNAAGRLSAAPGRLASSA